MLSFTLDTNCIIAIDEGRPEAAAVRRLTEAHAAGTADVAVVAIMASEKQKLGAEIETFGQFEDRLQRLGLGHLRLAYPPLYFDITFWDASVWINEKGTALERLIQETLFPDIEVEHHDFCQARGLDERSPGWEGPRQQWKNAKCDVLALWSHIMEERDVFVTSDRNFHKATKLPALIASGASRIEQPEAAAALLDED